MRLVTSRDRTVAIVGYPNHGKTVFVSGMFWDSFFNLSESLQDVRRPYAVRAVNTRAGEVFFGNAILLSNLDLPPSSPRTAPEPAVLEFQGIPDPKGRRRSARLTFYDIPGEAVSDESWLIQNAPFLPRVTDLVFLFDPTRSDFTARALQAADLRDRISRLVPHLARKNIIVALSKLDELRHTNEWADLIADLWPGYPPRVDNLGQYLGEMDRLSSMLRDWWMDRAQGGRGFVSQLPARARFCALSSLGQQPVWECGKCKTPQRDDRTECEECGEARPRGAPIRLARHPEPFRVRDPLFWIFRDAGLM